MVTLQSTWQSELQSEAVRQHIISLAVVTGHVSADTLSWSSALLHFMFSSWVVGQGCQALIFFSGKPCSVFFSHHCQLDLHKTLDKMYICRFGAEPALNMGRLCLLKLILFASWFHIWSYVGRRLIGIWDLVVYGLASQALSLWLAWIWTTLSILGIIYLCPSFEQQA